MYPEIKGWRDDTDAARVVDDLRATGWLAAACVISLDWDVLERVRACEPSVWLGLVFDDDRLFDHAVELAVADRRTLLDPDHRLLLARPERARQCRDAGIDVACWTVDDPGAAKRLVQMGVTRLTTNEVDLIREAVS